MTEQSFLAAVPSSLTQMTGRDALTAALRDRMLDDPRVVVLGETIRSGGAAGVTAGLYDEFGPERVIETPVSENGFFGLALGLALAGFKPVVEIYSADFLLAVANEVMNDMAKWRVQHGHPNLPLPIVIRGCMAATQGLGPEHSQSMEPFFFHAPGLRILTPSTPDNAYAAMHAALSATVPTLLFEHRRVYELTGDVRRSAASAKVGTADLVRHGDDVTVVAWGWMRHEAERACAVLAPDGINADLIDLVSIKPLDFETIVESVRRTGALLVVEEAFVTGSVGAEVLARVSEALPGQPLRLHRVAMPDVIHPYDARLERAILPTSTDVVRGVKSLLGR
jgi:acetoin:2,6-dichlorophenolindophenol oxidoreductase subunit beta